MNGRKKEIVVAIDEAQVGLTIKMLEDPDKWGAVVDKIKQRSIPNELIIKLHQLLIDILQFNDDEESVKVDSGYLKEAKNAEIQMAFSNLKHVLTVNPPETLEQLVDTIKFKLKIKGLRLPSNVVNSNAEELPIDDDLENPEEENTYELTINGTQYRVMLIANKKRVIVAVKFSETNDPGLKMKNLYDKWIPLLY